MDSDQINNFNLFKDQLEANSFSKSILKRANGSNFITADYILRT